MNRLISASLLLAFAAVLLVFTSLTGGQTAAAQPPSAPVATTTPKSGVVITSSQGMAVPAPAAPGLPRDIQPLATGAISKFYHIPGSVLTPVDSSTTLDYDSMGCIHAKLGGGDLLNAPLEVPEGSTLAGLRLYYYDANGSGSVNAWITRYNLDGTDYDDIAAVSSTGNAGYGNAWDDVDPTLNVVDTYNWSYVLNGRLNSPTSTLQICGFRVMYTPPSGCCAYLPSVMHSTSP